MISSGMYDRLLLWSGHVNVRTPHPRKVASWPNSARRPARFAPTRSMVYRDKPVSVRILDWNGRVNRASMVFVLANQLLSKMFAAVRGRIDALIGRLHFLPPESQMSCSFNSASSQSANT